jgi:di/tricarboxylate transporter
VTQLVPRFVTAYAVPILGVFLRIGIDSETGTRLPASAIAGLLARRFMSPCVFVFLGSMTMTTALNKLGILGQFLRWFLRRFSARPPFFLLALMLVNIVVGCFLSN